MYFFSLKECILISVALQYNLYFKLVLKAKFLFNILLQNTSVMHIVVK